MPNRLIFRKRGDWQQWQILSEFGSGLQGPSCLVFHKEIEQKFVMKKIECFDESAANVVFEEALFLKRSITHSAVNEFVSLFVHWDKELSAMFLCIAYEYHPAGDLLSLLWSQPTKDKAIDEMTIVRWLAELVDVLVYIHSKNVFHCDLKPANILIKDNGDLTITDFALPSVVLDLQQRTRSCLGSRDYWAPEIPRQPHNSKSDVWSLGCIFLQLVSCTFYDMKESMDNLDEIKHSAAALDKVLVKAKSIYSKNLLKAIKAMLTIDPNQRPDINELCKDNYVSQCLERLKAEKDAKIAGDFVPFEPGLSTLVYLKYVIDNISSRSCITSIFEHLWHMSEYDLLTLDTAKKQIMLQALRQHDDDVRIAELGLQILANQKVLGPTEEYLTSVDTLQLICTLMQTHQESVTVQKNSICLLLVGSLSEAALPSMYLVHAVSAIFKAWRFFSDNVQMSINCITILWSLSVHSGNTREMVQENGIVETVNAMKTHKDSSELFKASCALLVGFCLQDENVVQLRRLGCAVLILDGLVRHKKSHAAVRYACLALTAIILADEESAYRLLSSVIDDQEVQGIVHLFEIFNVHQTDSTLVMGFLNMFTELARYEDIASEMKYLGIEEIVSNIRKHYITNSEIEPMCKKVMARIDSIQPLMDPKLKKVC